MNSSPEPPSPLDSRSRLDRSRRELEAALAAVQGAAPLPILQERRRSTWILPVIAVGVGMVVALGLKRRR